MSPIATPLPTDAAASLRQDASVIGLVSLAHLISHFAQLLLPPLFPWLKEALGASYAELGFLMTVFFVVSCAVQALSGFAVDRFGPKPVLLTGLGLIGASAFGMAASSSYSLILLWVALAGTGNGVFHPVDYTLINRRVSPSRLGHAYSAHGISGNLGWAVAPALLVPLALAFSWRVALAVAGALIWLVLAILWLMRSYLLAPAPVSSAEAHHSEKVAGAGSLTFLRLPALWMCFGFFLLSAMALSVIQAFAPEAARQLHAMPVAWVAICLSAYMLSAAAGMVLGGFLAADPARSERVVAWGYTMAAALSLVLGLLVLPPLVAPVVFGFMGFAVGSAGPSRDLLIKRATPANASGRVYGIVYAGLDIGQAISPLIFGVLMDHQQFIAIFIGLAALQLSLVFNASRMRRYMRG